MRTCQGGNPNVVRRNWSPHALQLFAHYRVMLRRKYVDSKHHATNNQFVQPLFILGSISRLTDAVSIFAEGNHWQRHSFSDRENGLLSHCRHRPSPTARLYRQSIQVLSFKLTKLLIDDFVDASSLSCWSTPQDFEMILLKSEQIAGNCIRIPAHRLTSHPCAQPHPLPAPCVSAGIPRLRSPPKILSLGTSPWITFLSGR